MEIIWLYTRADISGSHMIFTAAKINKAHRASMQRFCAFLPLRAGFRACMLHCRMQNVLYFLSIDAKIIHGHAKRNYCTRNV